MKEYKQQSSVELRFKFLKDPMFVDSLFLKTPERIEALGYVLLIALFIYMTPTFYTYAILLRKLYISYFRNFTFTFPL
jgi:transposase